MPRAPELRPRETEWCGAARSYSWRPLYFIAIVRPPRPASTSPHPPLAPMRHDREVSSEVPLDSPRTWLEIPLPENTEPDGSPTEVLRADITWLTSSWNCIRSEERRVGKE